MHSTDDDAAQIGHVPPGTGECLDREELPLPSLNVPHDPDDGRIVGNAELAANRCARARGRDVDAVEDGEESPHVDALRADVLSDLVGHGNHRVDPS